MVSFVVRTFTQKNASHPGCSWQTTKGHPCHYVTRLDRLSRFGTVDASVIGQGASHQSRVLARSGEEFVVEFLLDDLFATRDDDLIGFTNGRKAMGDRDRGDAQFGDLGGSRLQLRVHGGCRLVELQYSGSGDRSAGYRRPLPLSSCKRGSAVDEPRDAQAASVRCLQRCAPAVQRLDVLWCRVRSGEGDVVPNAACEDLAAALLP